MLTELLAIKTAVEKALGRYACVEVVECPPAPGSPMVRISSTPVISASEVSAVDAAVNSVSNGLRYPVQVLWSNGVGTRLPQGD